MRRFRQKFISICLILIGFSVFISALAAGLRSTEPVHMPETAPAAEETITPIETETDFITTEEVEITEEINTETIPSSPVAPTPYVPQYYDIKKLSKNLQEHIFTLCEQYKLPSDIVISVIYRESSYNPNIMGDNGEAYGLMQVQPKWHQDRMDKLGVTNLLDPYQNVMVGIDYLGELAASGKPIEWVLMAYNGGPDYADYYFERGQITAYVTAIIEHSKTLKLKGEKGIWE